MKQNENIYKEDIKVNSEISDGMAERMEEERIHSLRGAAIIILSGFCGLVALFICLVVCLVVC